jgi:hypothetical protein
MFDVKNLIGCRCVVIIKLFDLITPMYISNQAIIDLFYMEEK